MRLHTLAMTAAAGLVIALVPSTAAEAAGKRPYAVSISVSAGQADVGQRLRLTGKVTGKKSAKKTLLVQHKVGNGGWRTVTRTRTTKKSRYSTAITVSTAGVQYLRVVAPKSSKRKLGVSRIRAFTGWRWLDLTTQRHTAPAGPAAFGPATVAGTTHPKAMTFRENGNIYAIDRKCTVLSARVGVKDGDTSFGLSYGLEYSDNGGVFPSQLSVEPREAAIAWTLTLTGRELLALGHPYGSGSVSVISPMVKCALNALPQPPARPRPSA